MRPRYYYDGGSFDDATIHRTKHCPELETPKPLAESTVEDIDAEHCPECPSVSDDLEPESESETEISEESETEVERESDIPELIQSGICPWCGDEFASVGRHASSAHADEWEQYKDE